MYSYRVDVVNRSSKHNTVQTITSQKPLTEQQAGDMSEKYLDWGKAVVVHDDPVAFTWGSAKEGLVRTVVLFCKQDEHAFRHLYI